MSDERNPLQIAVGSDFTIGNAEIIRGQLMEAIESADDIEVDLGRVAEFDSAGVQIMLAAKREAASRGRSLRFAGHSAAVLTTLDLLDLSARLGDPVLLQSNEQPGARS